MNAIFATILPVFGLIAAGYLAARVNYIKAEASSGIAQFVFNLAMPALLFRTVAGMEQAAASPWNLSLGLFSGLAIVWGLTMLLARFVTSEQGGGTAALCMAATFGNIAMLGLPLSLAHFGAAAALPVSLVLSVHAPLLWLAAVLHYETGRHQRLPSVPQLVRQLLRELLRNPIVLALLGGAVWHWAGLTLHPVPDRMLELLGSAGIPAALVALGLSLAGYSLKGQWSAITLVIAMKMLVTPLVIWLIFTYAVPVPPLWKQIAVMLAVMPTGANAYLFAKRYEQEAPAISGAIAAGTALAVITTSVLLTVLEAGYM